MQCLKPKIRKIDFKIKSRQIVKELVFTSTALSLFELVFRVQKKCQ